jgi:hypothetical protein
MPPTSCWPLLLPGLPVPVGTATKQHNSRAGAAMSMCYLGCTYAHASCIYLDCAGALRCMPCTVAAAAHAMPCGRPCLTHTRVLKFLPDHARARQQQQQCVILADCDTCTASTSPPPTCFFFASSSLLANSGSVRRLNRMATLVPLSMGSRGSFLNLWKQQQQSTPVVYHCTVCQWLRTAHVPVYSEWWNEGNLVLCKLLD